jgi:site-specific DNA-methyltransferase (adenine-specific)
MMTLGISSVSKGSLLPAAKTVSIPKASSTEDGSSRARDFRAISRVLGDTVQAMSSSAVLAHGDSLELLRKFPDHSVSLILTDPPYHSTKKGNIYGDTAFEEDQHYLDWMAEFAVEWKRILRPNGSLFCFCASEMSARLEVIFSTDFNILSQVVWTKPNEPGFDGWKQKMKKEALRQWYPHTERIIFAEPACEGNLHRSPFAQFLRETRQKTGMSSNQLAEITGAYGKVNHGGAVSNWETGRNIPSRDQYAKMCDALFATGLIDPMPPYEDVIRPFSMNGSKEFTDVWTFPSVRPYKGKHPAEKPSSMLEHAIEATSFPGDIVLDCFAGSGSTALAALKLGRLSISIEIDAQWIPKIAAALELEEMESKNRDDRDPGITIAPLLKAPQLPLFVVGK